MADSLFPAALAGLPVCTRRQLPIPFAAERDEVTGIANFVGLDPVAKDRIIAERLCGVCARPLDYWICFLGDEVSTGPDGAYVDSPMHERCCLAVMQVCPYIRHEKVPRRPLTDADKMVAKPGDFEGPKRPWVMACTRSFTTLRHPSYDARGKLDGVTLLFKPGTITRTRRFEYRAGLITEVTPASAAPAVIRRQQRRTTRAGRRS